MTLVQEPMSAMSQIYKMILSSPNMSFLNENPNAQTLTCLRLRLEAIKKKKNAKIADDKR